MKRDSYFLDLETTGLDPGAGLPGEQAHRALQDARDAVEVANALMAYFRTAGPL
jgi:hypothetical protein